MRRGDRRSTRQRRWFPYGVLEGQTAGAQAARSGASQGGENEPLAGNNVVPRTRAGGREGSDTPEAGVSAHGGVSAPRKMAAQ